MAFGALGFFLAVDKRLELVMAFLTDVLEDGHESLRIESPLESICGEFANYQFRARVFEGGADDNRLGRTSVPAASTAAQRAC
ncbi:MAG TPA: hypothetical protein VE398_15860, partial [Acidobacteriota bacterium]|nr:hypothetical protein [Acidobacteriota bacterium]